VYEDVSKPKLFHLAFFPLTTEQMAAYTHLSLEKTSRYGSACIRHEVLQNPRRCIINLYAPLSSMGPTLTKELEGSRADRVLLIRVIVSNGRVVTEIVGGQYSGRRGGV